MNVPLFGVQNRLIVWRLESFLFGDNRYRISVLGHRLEVDLSSQCCGFDTCFGSEILNKGVVFLGKLVMHHVGSQMMHCMLFNGDNLARLSELGHRLFRLLSHCCDFDVWGIACCA